MDMSKKAYNSPERKKKREERNKVFTDSIHKYCHPELSEKTKEPIKEEQIKDMEAWQKGIDENYNKDKENNMDREKFIEGHRLIRNFKREKREELIVNEFKCKELELIHKSLCENVEELKKEMEKNKDNIEKQFDIADDMGNIKHFIHNCKIMEIGMNNISKKYGWDK